MFPPIGEDSMINMPKSDTDEYRELKELGFEVENPQDGFSYQPDSGSSIGGEIGREEYGIDTDLDAEGRYDEQKNSEFEPESSNLQILGESEWSQQNRLPKDTLGGTPGNIEELFSLANERLVQSPFLILNQMRLREDWE